MKCTLCHICTLNIITYDTMVLSSHRFLSIPAGITDRYYYHCSENCDIDFCQVGVSKVGYPKNLHWLQSCLSSRRDHG